jgi:hypothetical protein
VRRYRRDRGRLGQRQQPRGAEHRHVTAAERCGGVWVTDDGAHRGAQADGQEPAGHR